MVGTLTNNSSVLDALDGADSCRLVSSDGDVSGLDFRLLQTDLQDSGFTVAAAAPAGTRGAFNACTANAQTLARPPIVPEPAPAPEAFMARQQTMTMGNG